MNTLLLSSITNLVTGKSLEQFIDEILVSPPTPYLYRSIIRKGAGKGRRRNCVVWHNK